MLLKPDIGDAEIPKLGPPAGQPRFPDEPIELFVIVKLQKLPQAAQLCFRGTDLRCLELPYSARRALQLPGHAFGRQVAILPP